jgi:hypothetical protein
MSNELIWNNITYANELINNKMNEYISDNMKTGIQCFINLATYIPVDNYRANDLQNLAQLLICNDDISLYYMQKIYDSQSDYNKLFIYIVCT